MKESVAIIIFNETKDQVLLIKRRDIPVWVLPGGGIEEGETPEVAAAREATEEIGCSVILVRKIAEYTPLNRITYFTHFYEGNISSGTPKSSPETKESRFFSTENLPKHLPPFYLYWINDAQKKFPTLLRNKIYGTSYFHLIRFLITHPCLTCRFLLTRLGIHYNS